MQKKGEILVIVFLQTGIKTYHKLVLQLFLAEILGMYRRNNSVSTKH